MICSNQKPSLEVEPETKVKGLSTLHASILASSDVLVSCASSFSCDKTMLSISGQDNAVINLKSKGVLTTALKASLSISPRAGSFHLDSGVEKNWKTVLLTSASEGLDKISGFPSLVIDDRSRLTAWVGRSSESLPLELDLRLPKLPRATLIGLERSRFRAGRGSILPCC